MNILMSGLVSLWTVMALQSPAMAGVPAPSSLAATTSSSSQIKLTWIDNSSTEAGFVIQRSVGSSNSFTNLAYVGTNTTSYSDGNLKASTTYFYRVAAYGKRWRSSSYSAYSNIANATTGSGSSTTALQITSGPSVSNVTASSATITWSLSEAATGQVEYGPSPSYGSLSAPETSFNYSTHIQTLSSLNSGMTYHYRVISQSASGSKVVSADQVFTTAGTSPSPGTSCVPTATTNCVGSYSVPALTNPINPTLSPYNCRGDGAYDNTSCLQAAIDAGDVLLPNGTYNVLGSVLMRNGHHFRCQSTSTTLMNSNDKTSNVQGIITWPSGSSGGSLSNCTLSGTNSSQPAGYIAGQEWNFLVLIRAGASNGLIVNNYFKNTYANSAIQVQGYGGSNPGTSGFTISNNEFRNCAYYGVALIAATNIQVNSNLAVDCAMGAEPDSTNEVVTNSTFDHNYVKKIYNDGYQAQAGWNMYIGMATNADASCNFSGFSFTNNTADGADIFLNKGNPAPTGSNNSCINGCHLNPF